MSFLSENFSPVGGQARSGNSPATWSYRSTDNLAAVLGAGYFNEIATTLRASDYIFTELSDTRAILTVQTVTLSPNADVVVINPIPYEPGQGNIQEGTQPPNGHVNGSPGDLYKLVLGVSSSLFVKGGTGLSNEEWFDLRDRDIMKFGCTSMSRSANTDQYLLPGPQNRIAQGADLIRMPFQGPAILSNLRVKQNPVGGAAVEPIVYTVMINGVATSLSVTLNADAVFAVNNGDVSTTSLAPEISIRATKEFNIVRSPKDIMVSVVLA